MVAACIQTNKRREKLERRMIAPAVAAVVYANFFDENFSSILNGIALGMLIFVLAIGLSLIFGLLGVIVVRAVIAVATYVVFERTQLGAVLRAAVEDRAMVAALGYNVDRVMLAVLVAGAALATFAGIIGGPIEQVTPGIGNDVLL